MKRRPLFLSLAAGLVATMGFGTPSQATPVTVSEAFSLSNVGTLADTIDSVTFNFTLPAGSTISDIAFNGSALNYNAAVPPYVTSVTPTFSQPGAPAGSTNSLELSFAGGVFIATGTVSFVTDAPTSDLGNLGKYITLNSETVVSPASMQEFSPITFSVSTIPEPASMALLGIGMTGLLAFRRLFKRNAAI